MKKTVQDVLSKYNAIDITSKRVSKLITNLILL